MPNNIMLSIFFADREEPDVVMAPIEPYEAGKQIEALSVQAMATERILSLTAEFVDFPEKEEEPPEEEAEEE